MSRDPRRDLRAKRRRRRRGERGVRRAAFRRMVAWTREKMDALADSYDRALNRAIWRVDSPPTFDALDDSFSVGFAVIDPQPTRRAHRLNNPMRPRTVGISERS
jgi:hypothetical protein